MTLSNLIYVSTSTHEMTQLDLVEIAMKAAQKNAQCEVTGMLLYSKGSFLQVLEGEAEQVERVFSIIQGDPRHCDLIGLLNGPIANRHFGQWAMGFRHLPPDVQNEEAYKACFNLTRQGFDADRLQARPGLALRLLLDFARR